MSADHEQDFVQWLANRLGTNVHPPMLAKQGFSLSGGRLLPARTARWPSSCIADEGSNT